MFGFVLLGMQEKASGKLPVDGQLVARCWPVGGHLAASG